MHQEEFEKTGFFNFNRTFKTSKIGFKRDPNKPGSNPPKICFIVIFRVNDFNGQECKSIYETQGTLICDLSKNDVNGQECKTFLENWGTLA